MNSPYCKDCRHAKFSFYWKEMMCHSSDQGYVDDPVRGRYIAWASCRNRRDSGRNLGCGPNGTEFEPSLRFRIWEWFARFWRVQSL